FGPAVGGRVRLIEIHQIANRAILADNPKLQVIAFPLCLRGAMSGHDSLAVLRVQEGLDAGELPFRRSSGIDTQDLPVFIVVTDDAPTQARPAVVAQMSELLRLRQSRRRLLVCGFEALALCDIVDL